MGTAHETQSAVISAGSRRNSLQLYGSMKASLMPRPNTASDHSSNEVRAGSSGTGSAAALDEPDEAVGDELGFGRPWRLAWNGNGRVAPWVRIRALRSTVEGVGQQLVDQLRTIRFVAQVQQVSGVVEEEPVDVRESAAQTARRLRRLDHEVRARRRGDRPWTSRPDRRR